MKRVKLVVAYDGTNYCGWQLQPNGVTIEEVLNRTLTELLREPIMVIGASRTDSGVHARRYVANFHADCTIPMDRLPFMPGETWRFLIQKTGCLQIKSVSL